MNLAIIAAGKGIRLKKEGLIISKPLVKINGVPLVERIIDMALKYGIDSISIIINEDSEELKKFIQNKYVNQTVNLIVKSTPSSLHSLYRLRESFTVPFLLTTTDSVFQGNEFNSFLDFADKLQNADGVIAVTNFIDDEKPLYTVINEKNRIVHFGDKKDGCEFITGGLYYFKKDIKTELEEAINSGVIRLRNFLRFLIQKDFQLYAYSFSKIIDVDHISDINKAEDFLSDNNSEKPGGKLP